VAKTQGVELMQRLNDGSLEEAPSAYLQETRENISSAIEELVEVGARIRPLCTGGKQTAGCAGLDQAFLLSPDPRAPRLTPRGFFLPTVDLMVGQILDDFPILKWVKCLFERY
jgi:hypothetical protein